MTEPAAATKASPGRWPMALFLVLAAIDLLLLSAVALEMFLGWMLLEGLAAFFRAVGALVALLERAGP